jgi:hypothetical protein
MPASAAILVVRTHWGSLLRSVLSRFHTLSVGLMPSSSSCDTEIERRVHACNHTCAYVHTCALRVSTARHSGGNRRRAYANADENVALGHLLEVGDGHVVRLERRELELAVRHVHKARAVAKDGVPPTTRARRNVQRLPRQTKGEEADHTRTVGCGAAYGRRVRTGVPQGRRLPLRHRLQRQQRQQQPAHRRA